MMYKEVNEPCPYCGALVTGKREPKLCPRCKTPLWYLPVEDETSDTAEGEKQKGGA